MLVWGYGNISLFGGLKSNMWSNRASLCPRIHTPFLNISSPEVLNLYFNISTKLELNTISVCMLSCNWALIFTVAKLTCANGQFLYFSTVAMNLAPNRRFLLMVVNFIWKSRCTRIYDYLVLLGIHSFG